MTARHPAPFAERYRNPTTTDLIMTGSIQMHSLNEALARERIADAHRAAEHARLVRRIRSLRRSRRLERRARKAQSRAELISSADYDLAS